MIRPLLSVNTAKTRIPDSGPSCFLRFSVSVILYTCYPSECFYLVRVLSSASPLDPSNPSSFMEPVWWIRHQRAPLWQALLISPATSVGGVTDGPGLAQTRHRVPGAHSHSRTGIHFLHLGFFRNVFFFLYPPPLLPFASLQPVSMLFSRPRVIRQVASDISRHAAPSFRFAPRESHTVIFDRWGPFSNESSSMCQPVPLPPPFLSPYMHGYNMASN